MEKEEGQELGKEKVPGQYVGSETNAVEAIELPSEEEARDFFQIVRERFLNVNQWYEIAQLPMSTFKLTNYLGKEVNRPVMEGDFFRIDIPGPGTEAGEGYDWVKIEELSEESSENEELLTLKARPSANPQNADSDTAHFYTEEAVSIFQIKRVGNKISAEEHGRNEVPNRKTDNIIDNVRNSIVGWAAKAGFSYPQWKSLMKGFVKR
ncbi:hypothetical protein Pedsa_1253 [Pseudopedobacter saltans DSM 12145]|uniref:Uncharacterized protein n=1 Tax=Pseudopedobacter saltans (strain ATCC 51119 / DSM 12145 / JCM 21818 / CCUG 39354 / LMG 10337 / NBRC 100064 / NCIMB 13643) TaxID=762903 RepID=F0SDS5_PSESL|nr:hypothetical protein [Pseudopedobacter saltans]ADY51821.1 hypothetical protein Pedsa_1253 [Pseudopedobacter saltans DSM 12145]